MTGDSKLMHSRQSEIIIKMCGMCHSVLFSLIQTPTNIKFSISIQTALSEVTFFKLPLEYLISMFTWWAET